MKVKLDEADRLLIGVAEEAMKRGVGRTFDSPTGQTLKVLAIDGEWIRLGYGPGFEERLDLPRRIREIASKTALIQGRVE